MHLITTHKLDAGASPVHTVTVFQSDFAEVVRKFTINLKAGDNIVEISHLPHTMVTESLRVAGIGQAMLSDVVCIMPKSRVMKLGQAGKSDELIKLEEEKSLLLGQKRVIDYKAHILVNYAHSITSEHVSPEDMLAFLQNFNAMGEQSAQAEMEFQRSLRELDKKIEKELNDPVAEHDNSHLRNIKVKLTINAEESHVAEISLTYLVKKATWTPVFDLRATTGADGKPTKKLALHYRATVNQSTGEDWTDAILNLSTASPSSFGTHIPVLHSMKVAMPKSWGQGIFNTGVKPAAANTNPYTSPFKNALFGTQQAPQLPATGGLFGSTGTNSLFGGSTATTTGFGRFSQPATGSLFGQAAQQPQQTAQSTTSPFSFASQSTIGPFSGGASTSGFGAAAPASTGLFGAASNPATSSGLFGAAFNPSGGAGFGSTSNPSAGTTQTSVFGSTAAAPNPPQAAAASVAPTTVNPAQPTEEFDHVGATDASEDDPEALPEMEIPSAVTKENSMAANFQVKGNANIRSDGTNHKVAIAVLNFEAKIQSVVVPRSIAGAYLHCTIHNSSKETHLLPGTMGVYLDDGYISNTAVPHVAPGDSFKCSLGRDHSVGVTFEQKSKPLYTQTHQFAANRDRALYTVQIVLKNKRDTPIKGLIIRDIVPVSDGEPIKVVLNKPAALAEAAEGKDIKVEDGVVVHWCESKGDKGGLKEGQLQWTVDLEKRETKTLVLEWEIHGPVGRNWQFEFHSPTKV